MSDNTKQLGSAPSPTEIFSVIAPAINRDDSRLRYYLKNYNTILNLFSMVFCANLWDNGKYNEFSVMPKEKQLEIFETSIGAKLEDLIFGDLDIRVIWHDDHVDVAVKDRETNIQYSMDEASIRAAEVGVAQFIYNHLGNKNEQSGN